MNIKSYMTDNGIVDENDAAFNDAATCVPHVFGGVGTSGSASWACCGDLPNYITYRQPDHICQVAGGLPTIVDPATGNIIAEIN